MRFWIALALVAAGCAPLRHVPATAPGAGEHSLVTALERARRALRVPGLAALRITAGHIGEPAVVGFRSLASRTPLEAADAFALNSVSKAMTATLVMQLVAEGRLSWDATLAATFPDLSIDPQYRSATLAEVATHRAGLPPHFTPADFDAVKAVPDIRQARRAILSRALSRSTGAARGRFAYSNVGYVILGAAIETVEAAPFEDVMRKRLFAALAMSSCGFEHPGSVLGHDRAGRPRSPREDADPPVMVPAGAGIYCSLSDWARFVADQIAGEGDAGRLLRSDGYRFLHTPPVGAYYAFGWGIASSQAGRVLSHAGGDGHWSTLLLVRPVDRSAVLLACNLAAGDALLPLIKELDASRPR
jgi:CubicO group peptidase (beta-lactamase class C family)